MFLFVGPLRPFVLPPPTPSREINSSQHEEIYRAVGPDYSTNNDTFLLSFNTASLTLETTVFVAISAVSSFVNYWEIDG